MSDNPNQRIRILMGSSSSGNNNREEDTEIRETTFDDLPDELIQTIMLHGASSFKDFVRARVMMSRMRDVSDQDGFLTTVDLYNMQTPFVDQTGLTNFRILCQHRGNVSALLLKGCSEFFRHSNLEDGMAIIRESAVRGYDLGIYVYSMLKRIMSPDDDLDRELINPNRNLISRMRKIVEATEYRYWASNPIPELFVDRVNNLDLGFIRRHRCASFDNWVQIWDESFKGREMCDVCFYRIHCLGFAKKFPKTIIDWPLRYNF